MVNAEVMSIPMIQDESEIAREITYAKPQKAANLDTERVERLAVSISWSAREYMRNYALKCTFSQASTKAKPDQAIGRTAKGVAEKAAKLATTTFAAPTEETVDAVEADVLDVDEATESSKLQKLHGVDVNFSTYC